MGGIQRFLSISIAIFCVDMMKRSSYSCVYKLVTSHIKMYGPVPLAKAVMVVHH